MWAIISGAGGGIRTPVAQRRQIYSLVVLATHPPLPFDDHIDLLAQMSILIPVKEIDNSFLLSFMWSPGRELNPQPADYKSAALPLSYRGLIFDWIIASSKISFNGILCIFANFLQSSNSGE